MESIRQRVQAVREAADDAEQAHSMEDTLHQDVLCSISNGEYADPAAAASEALKTLEIEFPRWCA